MALTLTLVPSTFAASLLTPNKTDMDQFEAKQVAPLTITSTTPGDITAKNGLRLMLDPNAAILWHESDVDFTGSAVESNKVKNNSLVYSKDRKSVFIPVEKDFQVDDTLVVTGLFLRAYDQDVDHGSFALDTNGDKIGDIINENAYEVSNDVEDDEVAPYPVQDLVYIMNPDKTITLKWKGPPDYDYASTIINRVETKNGQQETFFHSQEFGTEYKDTEVKLEGLNTLVYSLMAVDTEGNKSVSRDISIDLNSVGVQTPPSVPSTPDLDEPISDHEHEDQAHEEDQNLEEPTDAQMEYLRKRFYYFYLRYQADCISDSTTTIDEYACLWARIRLVHAQELTYLTVVPNLALSQADLDLMTQRRKWSQMRYQENCLNTQTPANYCPLLKEDVDRISYFLD